jgi:hypothetical protein
MDKRHKKNEARVQIQKIEKSDKLERLGFILYAPVRRHSRVLYLPLDPNIVNLHKIKKGDYIKFNLLKLKRGPPEGDEE